MLHPSNPYFLAYLVGKFPQLAFEDLQIYSLSLLKIIDVYSHSHLIDLFVQLMTQNHLVVLELIQVLFLKIDYLSIQFYPS